MLTPEETQIRLRNLPGWSIETGKLVKNFQFKDFAAALDFVNRLGAAAEQASHHPDIDIRYNRVRLVLVTHDAGGLTDKDFSFTDVVERLLYSGGLQ